MRESNRERNKGSVSHEYPDRRAYQSHRCLRAENSTHRAGATYDPNVLARLGVVGVSAEVEKARSWYQKAETLGSPDARWRLDLLASH